MLVKDFLSSLEDVFKFACSPFPATPLLTPAVSNPAAKKPVEATQTALRAGHRGADVLWR